MQIYNRKRDCLWVRLSLIHIFSPIGEFNIRGERYKVGNGGIGLLSQKIYTSLTDIQWGRAEDKYGWTVEVK